MGAGNVGDWRAALILTAFVPWIVGPTAIVALLAVRSTSRRRAWSHLGAEVVVVGSSAVLWVWLFLRPDAQNGIAIVVFPVVQYAGVLLWCLGVFVAAMFMRGRA